MGDRLEILFNRILLSALSVSLNRATFMLKDSFW